MHQFFLSLLLLIVAQFIGYLPYSIGIHAGWDARLGAVALLVGQILGAILSVVGFVWIIQWRARRPAWEFHPENRNESGPKPASK